MRCPAPASSRRRRRCGSARSSSAAPCAGIVGRQPQRLAAVRDDDLPVLGGLAAVEQRVGQVGGLRIQCLDGRILRIRAPGRAVAGRADALEGAAAGLEIRSGSCRCGQARGRQASAARSPAQRLPEQSKPRQELSARSGVRIHLQRSSRLVVSRGRRGTSSAPLAPPHRVTRARVSFRDRLQLRVPDRGEHMFPASMTIAGFDPELAAAHRSRARPPGRPHRADRLRELREPARARGAGLRAHQQVRRRLSGQALLRRLRIRRRRRAAGDRPREEAVRRRRSPTCSRTPARRPMPPRTSR